MAAVGASATVRARSATAALDKMSARIERALVGAMASSLDAGYRSLKNTRAFRDRTYSLRDAFRVHADETADGEFFVDVDPEQPARRGTTPPAQYARFVNFGTSRITPRGFAEDAQEKVETRLRALLERLFGAAPDLNVDEQ
jgi:HK97 gp10 family phage protein